MVEEASGFAGGIWVLWDKGSFDISLVESGDQFIHCQVKTAKGESFVWTVVYASPQEEKRKGLWDTLKRIGRNINLPWVLSGDFNEIAAHEEKRGGSPVDTRKCCMFTEVLDDCGVIDLGGVGPFFTWKEPKFSHLERVYKRLYRVVATSSWRTQFAEAQIQVLPRIHLDHNPIIIQMELEAQRRRERDPLGLKQYGKTTKDLDHSSANAGDTKIPS